MTYDKPSPKEVDHSEENRLWAQNHLKDMDYFDGTNYRFLDGRGVEVEDHELRALYSLATGQFLFPRKIDDQNFYVVERHFQREDQRLKKPPPWKNKVEKL